MIVAENLQKRFGAVVAVNGVNLAATNGTVTGLLGPNGAGKTTTLRMLYAVMKPDSGRIDIDGVDAVADPQQAQAQLGVCRTATGCTRDSPLASTFTTSASCTGSRDVTCGNARRSCWKCST